jgi:hypothetical protein
MPKVVAQATAIGKRPIDVLVYGLGIAFPASMHKENTWLPELS